MKLRFRKKRSGSSLHCTRADGSETWTVIGAAIEFHDLAHYAVETELSFSNAFYGLLAKGYAISDFDLPRDKRPEALLPKNLPAEALQTEHLVNLLQIYRDEAISPDAFLDSFRQILGEHQLDYPERLDAQKLEAIKERLYELLALWNNLEDGDILELQFGN